MYTQQINASSYYNDKNGRPKDPQDVTRLAIIIKTPYKNYNYVPSFDKDCNV